MKNKKTLAARLWNYLSEQNRLNWIPDKAFVKLNYMFHMNRVLNLKNPERFTEKLQWLKLYNRNPLYTTLADKYLVRNYVEKIIGKDVLIPLLGVWEKPTDIDYGLLPDKFVLKCNHDSGGVIVCKDKEIFDFEKATSKLSQNQSFNFFWKGREWPYKNIKKKIIAEKYMVDASGYELKDYKFFCFNGKVKFFKIDFDRFVDHHANYYSPELMLLPFGEYDFPPNPEKKLEFPPNISEMIIVAEKLAENIPFVRVDLYNINGHIYFGEMTFFPAGGKRPFDPDEWDYTLGKWIDLPEKKVES